MISCGCDNLVPEWALVLPAWQIHKGLQEAALTRIIKPFPLITQNSPPAVSPLPHFPPSPPPSSSHIFATVVVLLMLKLGHESEDFPILCFADDIPLVSFDLFLYSLYL